MFGSYKLNGKWKLGGFEPGGGDIPAFEMPFTVDVDVPDEIHTALMTAGVMSEDALLSDPHRYGWINEKEWWYQRIVELPDGFLRKRTYLEFDGLDTLATIVVNSEVVGVTRDMFLPKRFDVTGVIREDIGNVIEVRFAAPSKLEETLETFGAGVRKMRRDLEGTYGLWGAGIWRDARLVTRDCVSIRDIAIQPNIEFHGAEAWITIDIENLCGEQVNALISLVVSREDSREKMELKEAIPPQGRKVETVVRIEEPEFWWPNGMGEQPLYGVMVGVQVEGEVADVAERFFALREVSLRSPALHPGENIPLVVNYQDVDVQCEMWTPPDLFPSRMTDDRYREILTDMKSRGVQMLRVWGGGVYENPIFYSLCDAYGIMVWQDFMFASGPIPDDPSFIADTRREVADVVRRLRNHPSIVMWCSGTQNAEAKFYETIEQMLHQMDSARPYLPRVMCGE